MKYEPEKKEFYGSQAYIFMLEFLVALGWSILAILLPILLLT